MLEKIKDETMDNQQPSSVSGEGSETIPNGSSATEHETVTLFKFYVLKDPRDDSIKYVGRTVDVDNRYRNHIYEAKKNNKNKRERWIMSLIRKNLKPVMQVIYEENCSIDEAVDIEKMLYKKLSARYSLKNEADNFLGALKTGRPVYQYSIEGNLLSSFENANQAMIITGVKDSNIGRCCKNENGYGTKTAGGYFWSFIKYEKYPHKYISNWRSLKGKPVQQYSLDGTFLNEFPTARRANKSTGVSYKKISAVCNGRRNTAGGYIWKFKQ